MNRKQPRLIPTIVGIALCAALLVAVSTRLTFASGALLSPTVSVLCVDDSGGPTGAPCSNATAYTSIQAAVSAASAGNEIRVASGSYGDTTFDKNLTLGGGYAGGAGGYGTPSSSNIASLAGQIRFSGSPTVTVGLQGFLTWSSGTFQGYFATGVVYVSPGAVFTMQGSSMLLIESVIFNNSGTIAWGGTGDLRYRFGTVNNQSGGLFDIRSDATMLIYGGDGGADFTNLPGATVRKSAGTGTSTIGAGQGPTFVNNGTVEVQTGTLAFTSSLSPHLHSGLYNISNGASVCFCSYISNLTTGAQFTGGGTVIVGGGTANVNGNVTVGPSAHFRLEAGTLGGSNGNLTVNGFFDWTGGVMSSSTLTTTIGSGGTMTLSGSAEKLLEYATINNSGTLIWTGTGNFRGRIDPTINNLSGGLFDAQSAASMYVGGGDGTAYFNNLGGATLRKATSGVTTIGAGQGFALMNSGTVDIQAGTLELGGTIGTHVQVGGMIKLNGGNLALSGPFDMQGGILMGSGTIAGDLLNSGGTLRPGGTTPGMLAISGNYTQGAGATLDLDAAGTTPGTEFDQVNVGGVATFRGTLNVNFLNGYSAANGTRLQVVTYATRQLGIFSSLNSSPFNVVANLTGNMTLCLQQFVDVAADSTFYDFVHCMSCRGIINGYPCGADGEPCNENNDPYFRPGNQVTRGQLSKMVSNSAGFSEPHTEQTFEDVPPGSTFYDFIERLYSRGIIGGYSCGGEGEPCGPDSRPYFRPNANVTRGQSAKIIAIARNLPAPPSGQQTFEDVPESSTFWTWIEALATSGAINGYPCGGEGEPCGPYSRPYFRPARDITRGQSAKVVTNSFYPGGQTP